MNVGRVDAELLEAHMKELGFFDERLLNALKVSRIAKADDLRAILGFQHNVHEVILGVRPLAFRMGFEL